MPLPTDEFDPWGELLLAIEELRADVQRIRLKEPVVNVDPPDLSEIVTAVQGIKGPATAPEIAQAIADKLRIPEPQNLTPLADAISELKKTLDHRLRGVGTQAYGGGSVSLQPNQTVGINGTASTKEVRAATPTHTSVAGSTSSVTLLAANADRLGATIYNDSTANLFLKMGATASTTSFTLKMVADAYFEVPYGYTGVIDGVWATATGNARIAELV